MHSHYIEKEKSNLQANTSAQQLHRTARRIWALLQGMWALCSTFKGKCCCGLTEVGASRKTKAGVTSAGARLREIVNQLESDEMQQ